VPERAGPFRNKAHREHIVSAAHPIVLQKYFEHFVAQH
jgi:hypothetical protein